MKSTDLIRTTSQKLNESLEKTFGKKINFSKFTEMQLEDARNKLRTQVHQMKSNSSFNENLDNDAFHEAQWMLDAINAELAEREEPVSEGQDVDENTVRELLKKFDQKANDDYRAYGDVNPETVIRHLEQGDVEAARDEVAFAYYGDDGEEPGRGFDDLLQDLEDDFQAVIEYENDDFDFRQEYDDDPMDDMMDSIERNDDVVTESEVEEASAIVTAKTMVDKVSRWIEELSGMENDTLISLGDSIRTEMGSQQAKQFLGSTAPAIEDALNHLKQTRDEMSTALRVLTGEESATDMLGDEPDDVPADIDMDDEEMDLDDDDFAVAEPATGGEEAAGREQRESVEKQNTLYRILAG
jgi:hypothetical protein